MEVRRFFPEDLEAVVAMAQGFHAESPVHSAFPFDQEKVEALVTNASINPDWLAAVAYEGDELAGLLLVCVQEMFFSRTRAVYDLTLFVAPDRRGGKAFIGLVAYLKQWAESVGASVIDLAINTGIAHERASKSFAKLGFSEIGTVIRCPVSPLP